MNIFNLFLFLLLLWIALMLVFSHIGVVYILCGILFCVAISFSAFKLKIIDERSELLYLSFGFYAHFFKIYCANFLKSCNLILDLALNKNLVEPLIYKVKIDYENKFNPALMAASINFSAGLLCIKVEKNIFHIHALDEKYFRDFHIEIMRKKLPDINDDNLV